jgi:hypothetical protein
MKYIITCFMQMKSVATIATVTTGKEEGVPFFGAPAWCAANASA